MNSISIFKFEEKQIRTITVNEEPYFVAKDVTDALNLANGRDAVSRLDSDEKSTVGISDTSSNGVTQVRDYTIINESGLYSLIMTSTKPEAKKFKKWVTSEVLPSIRKNGGYLAPTVDFSDPSVMMNLLENWKKDRERLIEANKTIEQQKPKVVFADAVSVSEDCILIGELAKILKTNGVDIGQNRLFDWMRTKGYLIERDSKNKNFPSQKSLELKLFDIKENVVLLPDGTSRLKFTTKVNPKGQQYFINKFLNKGE